MPVRPLIMFPDLRLRQAAASVETFGPELETLAADLRDTLVAASAIGLTALHIGVLQRLVVVRMTPDEAVRTYVNPAILWSSPETEAH